MLMELQQEQRLKAHKHELPAEMDLGVLTQHGKNFR